MADRETTPATLRVLDAGPDVEAVVLVLSGTIRADDIAALCDQVGAVLRANDAGVVVCDVGALAAPDMITVDALARLTLTARRLGHTVRLRNAGDTLRDLLSQVGLCHPLGLDALPALDEA